MIVPLTPEDVWLDRLQALPSWEPTDAPLLVVAPHPDDETLAVGGLIAAQTARGASVTVVAVTDGEHAYTENDGLAAIRRQEQTDALARLGVPSENIVRLQFTDSSVAGQEQELVRQLTPLITVETQVLAPWSGDFHPDHEACARAAASVASSTGATLISYFFWTWHRGKVSALDGLTLRKFALSEQLVSLKLAALACHRSQLQHAPEQEILPDNLLWPARLPFEVFAL